MHESFSAARCRGPIDKEQIGAAFAELAGLRRALGKSSYSAMKALLPFSRNDYWEVSELRQRLN